MERRGGIIVSIAKKREAVKMGDYRGVILMSSAYKVYAMVLANRLEKEVEKKRIIPEFQTGFKKGKGVIDNIYILNYLMEESWRKERKWWQC